eukprot:TRINITY_DN14165_c0_g1_i1.p1 TRINITY_DN14165_c0_g1~~TRINITY_DN14165_c0_g1_i1.p1  ORF type:complete len:519 (-),score=58.71 TRINITY_DN14165_c0_g1_i1:179-1735(-)
MIDYRAGNWGFHVAFTHCIGGSLVPKALTMAIPNAILTFFIATLLQKPGADEFEAGIVTVFHPDTAGAAGMAMTAFTAVMTFVLYNRSSIAYDRWWEGGTLLQKTRGEWFNAYSSIMAFTSTKPELEPQVTEYQHLLARLMSLLMCCGLQQVSPNRDRPFEIIDLEGIDPESLDFLNTAPDKVEIILQWIQRSMVLHAQTGVLPVAPPILSRAFQEFSRGIVNLQNARKIADFPYPYPLAQISMVLQMLHWLMTPLGAALAVPRFWAVLASFFSIFVLWCIHFNAIELEFPFGSRANDLPMVQLQQEWNESIRTLLDKRATKPPLFDYQPDFHDDLNMAMSDASEYKRPKKKAGRQSLRSRASIRTGHSVRINHPKGANAKSVVFRTRQTSEDSAPTRQVLGEQMPGEREISGSSTAPALKSETEDVRVPATSSTAPAPVEEIQSSSPEQRGGLELHPGDTADPDDRINSPRNRQTAQPTAQSEGAGQSRAGIPASATSMASSSPPVPRGDPLHVHNV